MISKALPDPRLFKDVALQSLKNKIIYNSSTAKYHYPTHTTPYLLVANFNNTGNYLLNNRPVFVNDHIFYFLNPGDRLQINFKPTNNLETLLIQFGDQFMCDWVGYKRSGIMKLLDQPVSARYEEWSIPNVPFEYNAMISDQLNSLIRSDSGADTDISLMGLLDSFWFIKEKSHDRLNNISALRKSTKEEIFRRLLIAKQYIHDNFTSSPPIDLLAAEACLNKFHFLKLFRECYGITPHQYLVKLKLEYAHSLLTKGNYSIFEVCHLSGFESQGSFTNLFKRTYGILPSSTRANSQL